MYLKPSSSACRSSSRSNLGNMSWSPAPASWPYWRRSSLKIIPTPRPSWASCAFASCSAERPAGERERVHRRVVEDGEAPGQVGALRGGGHLLPDGRDVLLHLRVGILPDALLYLRRAFLADRDLLVLRDERELALARDRVADA